MYRRIALSFTFIFLLTGLVWADDPPAWLQEAARLTVPTYDIKDVPAVVLRDEESVTVSADGTVIRTHRYAIKVLTREGKDEADARAVYTTDTEKVREINAWLIRKSGPVKVYGKKDVIDAVLAPNDLYNEARVRFIDGSLEAADGDVFGYESVTEEHNVFSQFRFAFQYNLPSLYSSFTVSLPEGWRAEGVTFNTAKIEPVVSGSTYSWQMRNLQPIRPETRSPSYTSLSPRLAVSFYPAQAMATQIKTFASWSDVAKWMSEIEDPQMTVDDALAGKVHDLTDGASTEMDKIRAIAKYVQQIQYISVQIGVGRGGGYVPHSSTEVFAKSYGDCKDKANLMRAMLSVLHIPSYLVSITADDAEYVRAEWPSPHQFNHCIIAIKIADPAGVQTVVEHPKLGKLMIFDPTDSNTPVGDLPEDEQGSLALIDHKETNELIRMPIVSADLNKLDRTISVDLSPEGAISGSLLESSNGQAAATERGRLRALSSSEYSRMIEGWVSRGAAGAKTSNIKTSDDDRGGKFDLNVDFSAAAYAQIMQGRLMVFKPAIIGRLERFSFSDGARLNPFVIDSSSFSETVKFKLPVGFVVDETPDAIDLKASFGTYSAKYQVVGDQLIFTRSLKLSRATVPADKFAAVRDFFGGMHQAEQSQVVLLKK